MYYEKKTKIEYYNNKKINFQIVKIVRTYV